MKKISIILLFCLLLTSLLCIEGYAMDCDAVRVEDDGVLIIKHYEGYFIYCFAENMAIEEIMQSDFIDKAVEDVVFEEHNYYDQSGHGCISTFFKYILHAEELFDSIGLSNIKINNIYCLHGTFRSGVYIYYVTDQGDYVYYKDYASAEKEYLFPFDVICEIGRAVMAEYATWPADMVGTLLPEHVYDVSPYEISLTLAEGTVTFPETSDVFDTEQTVETGVPETIEENVTSDLDAESVSPETTDATQIETAEDTDAATTLEVECEENVLAALQGTPEHSDITSTKNSRGLYWLISAIIGIVAVSGIVCALLITKKKK